MKKPTSSPQSRASRFDIPTNWTSEQALAVFNLLDAITYRVWLHYEPQLIRQMMKQDAPLLGLPDPDHWVRVDGRSSDVSPDDLPDDDIPF
jgi:hypothetical protein